MGEFFRVGFNSPDGFESTVENLARKYAHMREELIALYGDNQDELYKKLGELNQTFESALHSTVLLPLQAIPTGITGSDMPQSVRNAMEREQQEHKAINDFMPLLKQNMIRHLDSFFEIFIESIQNNDFDSAFAGSIEKVSNGESRSLSDVSFSDTVAIRDTLMQGRYEKDENDNDVFIFNKPINSIRSITAGTRISEVIRRELTELIGFAWRD
jgi:hypothetical protein